MKDRKKQMFKKFFASLLLFVTCFSNSLFATVSAISNDELADGEVAFEKTAEWADIEEGIAKITLKVKAKPVVRPVDVVLVVDRSGSMSFNSSGTQASNYSECLNPEHEFDNGHYYSKTNSDNANYWTNEDKYDKDEGCIDRLDVAKSAVSSFLTSFYSDEKNADSRVALVTFSSNATKKCDFTTSKDNITSALSDVTANGGTNYNDALSKASEYINNRSSETSSRPSYIIFLTDGDPSYSSWTGTSQAKTLKDNGTIIYAVGIGENLNTNYIEAISSGSGYYTTTKTAAGLTSIYSSIASKMKNAGTDQKVSDVISDDFEYYEDETNGYMPSETPTTYPTEANGNVIEWTKKEITDTEKEYSFYVKIKNDAQHQNGQWPTNDGATLTYKDVDGKDQEKEVEDPVLGRNKYVVEYYLQNEDGSTYPTTPNESYTFISKVGSNVSAEQKVFDKYTLDTNISNTNGTVTADGNLVLKLYYARVKGTVTVKYVDQDGNEIPNTKEIKTGVLDTTYNTVDKVIPGYKLVQKPDNASGVFVEGNTDVIYIYERVVGTVTIKYVDENGNEIKASDVLTNKYVGDTYTTEAAKIENYEVKIVPDNATGTVVEGNTTVTYVYAKKRRKRYCKICR